MTDVAAGARSSKGRTRFTPRAALLVLVLVALLVYLAVPVKAYLAERSHVGQLQQQTQVLQRQNVALRGDLVRGRAQGRRWGIQPRRVLMSR